MIVYNHKLILEELGLTQEEFRQICILSGTDYNSNFKNNNNLTNSLKLFKKYKKDLKKNKCEDGFYNWIMNSNANSHIEDYEMLMNIYEIFDLSTEKHKMIHNFDNIKIMNGSINMDGMKPILIEEGFIF